MLRKTSSMMRIMVARSMFLNSLNSEKELIKTWFWFNGWVLVLTGITIDIERIDGFKISKRKEDSGWPNLFIGKAFGPRFGFYSKTVFVGFEEGAFVGFAEQSGHLQSAAYVLRVLAGHAERGIRTGRSHFQKYRGFPGVFVQQGANGPVKAGTNLDGNTSVPVQVHGELAGIAGPTAFDHKPILLNEIAIQKRLNRRFEVGKELRAGFFAGFAGWGGSC
jgi:hypothetical protein